MLNKNGENEDEWQMCLLYRAEVSPDGRQLTTTPPRGQHKNRTIKEINQHTVATILHTVSLKIDETRFKKTTPTKTNNQIKSLF